MCPIYPFQLQGLEESVVNKIAAGEVVQRPHNALKEILENCIDAGSTKISIVVRDGGNTLIQVQDNGSGIHAEDLPMLCERHATSKLEKFEDLAKMRTLGFRGEALCSISYVSHLTVTTMRQGDGHATRTVFRDSKIEEGPKACAGLVGTTVHVEDLFYNMPIRRKALKSSSEELSKVLEVVGRYAIFHEGVGITLKRQGNQRPDLCTGQKDTTLEKIRMVFGSQVGSNLLPFESCPQDSSNGSTPSTSGGELQFSAKGFASSANYTAGRRTVLVLFINGRLVECTPLKRSLETVYASILSKTSKPFFYVSVTMPTEHVDVNVHPTKKEVHFLHQDDLIESLRCSVEKAVFSSNDHRTYYKQTLIPGAGNINTTEAEPAPRKRRLEGGQSQGATRRDRAGGDYKLVRTDAHEKKLETFFFSQDKALSSSLLEDSSREKRSSGTGGLSKAGDQQKDNDPGMGESKRPSMHQEILLSQLEASPPEEEREEEIRAARSKESCGLTSVKELLAEAFVDTHFELTDILKNHVYVGMADERRALIQHKTKLYLINVKTMSKDMMYQQTLHKFGRLPKLRFQSKLSLSGLLMLQMEVEEEKGNWTDEDGDKQEAVDLVVDLLVSKSEMLEDYFSLEIDAEGYLAAIPLVADKSYVPDMRKLPNFLLCLGHDTDWESEKGCFMSIADAIADFYSAEMTCVSPYRNPEEGKDEELEALCKEEEHTIQNVVFPCMRTMLKPSAKRATDATVVQVASLERLYKIFERC
ncbi:DNA mismatch repair protein MLH1 [Chloropicon primus]|uniref:DNA mismatch repair protein MLH1 n=3 Tax=Chloropicon primus TaxID=1764295 RepID=A0A5B8MQA5_9CHLO|nr:DNA mismatch repair protein MLH1 [Chloropicon primus]|eukprot:QDZ22878.1 DNA mismatch repair protein MLH1 [Chloropicon primus]